MTAITFQTRVQPWLLACFGAEIAADRAERNHRFLEESLELVQSCGCTASEAHQLVDYVFGRPVGDPAQETGGVMVTLAALCLANSLDMHEAGETELARIWTKVEAIRAKQAAKPKHSPLPAAPAAVAGPADDLTELELLNKLIELGGEASYALAQSNSDDGRAGAEADDRWRKLRAEMGELIRAHKAPALEAPAAPAEFDAWWERAGDGRSKLMAKQAWDAALAAAPQAPAAPGYPTKFGPDDWIMVVAGIPVKRDEWSPGAVMARTIYGEAAPAAPVGEFTLIDEGGPVELAGAQAQYSIERADGSTAAWILGDESAAAELMAALRMPVSGHCAAAPAAPVAVPAQGDPAALLQLAEVLESGRSLIHDERKEAAHALRLQATAAPAAPAVDAPALGEWVATLEVDSEGGLDYETVPPCTLPPGCYRLYRAAQAKEGGEAA